MKTIEDLEKRLGQDMETWTLGRLQVIEQEHSPFGKTPLKYLLNYKHPHPGTRRTNNPATFFYHMEPYSPKFGAIVRVVADMGDDDKMFAAADSGYEQRPGWAHYADLFPDFFKGKYQQLATSTNTKDWPSSPDTRILTVEPAKKTGQAKAEEL